MSHTPGSWQRDGWGGITATVNGEKRTIARVYWENGRLADAAANERLIGSAPDLLAACELLLLYGTTKKAVSAAEAAIKKARGK